MQRSVRRLEQSAVVGMRLAAARQASTNPPSSGGGLQQHLPGGNVGDDAEEKDQEESELPHAQLHPTTAPLLALLSRSPSDLYVLWREYEFGIDSQHKAAKNFTRHERGKIRQQFSFRNRYWQIVATLVRRGHSAFDAIDLILQKYGHHSSVTKIIRAIAADKGVRVLGITG